MANGRRIVGGVIATLIAAGLVAWIGYVLYGLLGSGTSRVVIESTDQPAPQSDVRRRRPAPYQPRDVVSAEVPWLNDKPDLEYPFARAGKYAAVELSATPWRPLHPFEPAAVDYAGLPWINSPRRPELASVSTAVVPVFPEVPNPDRPMRAFVTLAYMPSFPDRPNPGRPRMAFVEPATIPWLRTARDIDHAHVSVAYMPELPVYLNPKRPVPAIVKSADLPWNGLKPADPLPVELYPARLPSFRPAPSVTNTPASMPATQPR